MIVTKWEEFNVPFQSEEKVALVGVDLGAGNCSAAIVDETAPGKTRSLFFDSDQKDSNIYTAISYDKENEFLGIEASDTERRIWGPFTNFKRPPGNSAMEHFDEDLNNPTYEELMRRFFQAVVQRLFDCSKDLHRVQQVILFVGRPASSRWRDRAVDYQKLLTEGMQISGYSGRIDVMICSEAEAALAYEYSYKNIGRDEVVLIVDCGSSTFDAALVRNREIIGEYSRQLGAGQIEHLMYARILAQDDVEPLKDVWKRTEMVRERSARLVNSHKGDHILKLRERKEQFFGSRGDNGDREDLRYGRIRLSNTGKLAQDIDEDFMEEVLGTIPVLVEFSYSGVGSDCEDTIYPSFMAASLDFLRKTKEKICDANGVTVDRVILTGGASVMPFITDQVKEVFGDGVFGMCNGVPVRRTKEPAFSVGKGLAFMGHVEFLKRLVMEKCEKLIREELEESDSEIHNILTQAYVDTGWSALIGDLQIWKSTDKYGSTFVEGVMGGGFHRPEREIQKRIQEHLHSHRDGQGRTLEARLKAIIDATIKQLFDYSSSCTVEVNKEDVRQVIGTSSAEEHPLNKIEYDCKVLLGDTREAEQYDLCLSRSVREKYYSMVLRRESQVRADLRCQLVEKTTAPKDRLKERIADRMMKDLAAYLEEITPFVVERVQTKTMDIGGFI